MTVSTNACTAQTADNAHINPHKPRGHFIPVNGFRTIYSVCDACRRDHGIRLGDYMKRTIDMNSWVTCDACGIRPTDDKPTVWPTERERAAKRAYLFLRSYSVECHITLTNMIRAAELYTYYDADGMLCSDTEWHHPDPNDMNNIYQFLGL